VNAIVRAVNGRAPVSAALGELADLTTAGDAMSRVMFAGVANPTALHFVKAGLANAANDWRERWRRLREAASPASLIAVAYADAARVHAPTFDEVVRFAIDESAAGLLADTAIKDGRGLFDWLDEATLRLIVRTFIDSYPHAQAFIAHYNVHTPMLGLVGANEPLTFPPDWFEKRTAGTRIVQGLYAQRQALYDRFALFGAYVVSREELERFAGDGPLNTDDRPLVMFRAPRFIYQHHADRYGRLMTLLEETEGDPSNLIAIEDGESDAEVAEFLDALRKYQNARDRFLDGAMHESENRLDEALAAYIESARESRYFVMGYLNAHQLAMRIASQDTVTARWILEQLREANPDRPEALQSLRRLPRGE